MKRTYETETPVLHALVLHIFHVVYVRPVSAGMTRPLSVAPAMYGNILTVRVWILPCMKSTTKPWIGAWHGYASSVACQTSQLLYSIQWA